MEKEDVVVMLLFKFLHNIADIHNFSGEELNPHDEVFEKEVKQCAKLIVDMGLAGKN
jgi:hypothetical protein